MSSSIDSLLHIVVFAAIFSSSSNVVNSAPQNYSDCLNPRRMDIIVFYYPIQDANSYVKLSARIGETIDIPVVCPQSKEAGDKFALVYRVESRHEFDNCLIDEDKLDKLVGIMECEGSRPTQTAKLAINYSTIPNHIELEEGKEYFFISTSYGPGDRFDRLCDGFFVRFSITVNSKTAREIEEEARRQEIAERVLLSIVDNVDNVDYED